MKGGRSGGEAGVREVIGNIIAEFDLTLALSGLNRASDPGPECLEGAAMGQAPSDRKIMDLAGTGDASGISQSVHAAATMAA